MVELGVGLAATATLGLLLWGVVPQQQQQKDRLAWQQTLNEVQSAVLGYTQRKSRLPCPAEDTGGVESCATGLREGWLPWKTLGLTQGDSVFRYGVGSSALTQTSTSFVPNLPPAPAAVAATYDALATSNGLDFCQSLRIVLVTSAANTIADAPYAWVVAHPGSNRVFDGANVGGFALPGLAQSVSPVYDDAVLAQSPAELSARLACPQRLAEAQVAARSAYAAYDLWRNVDAFSQFRAFAHQVRQTNVTYAGVGLAMAVTEIVNAGATGITALAITAAGGGGSAAAAADIAALTIATGAAIGAAGVAGFKLATSILAEIKAGRQKTAAQAELVKAGMEYVEGYTAATTADQKGLQP
ncbi:hypothetical protein GCM10028785_30880 [Hydrogenophaga soli]